MKKNKIETLVPLNTRTAEDKKRIAKMGGLASAKSRRERKTMKETLEYLIDLPCTDEQIKQFLSENNIVDEEQTIATALAFMLIKRCLESGDVKAFELIRDTIGEKPFNRVEIGDEHIVIDVEIEE